MDWLLDWIRGELERLSKENKKSNPTVTEKIDDLIRKIDRERLLGRHY